MLRNGLRKLLIITPPTFTSQWRYFTTVFNDMQYKYAIL